MEGVHLRLQAKCTEGRCGQIVLNNKSLAELDQRLMITAYDVIVHVVPHPNRELRGAFGKGHQRLVNEENIRTRRARISGECGCANQAVDRAFPRTDLQCVRIAFWKPEIKQFLCLECRLRHGWLPEV